MDKIETFNPLKMKLPKVGMEGFVSPGEIVARQTAAADKVKVSGFDIRARGQFSGLTGLRSEGAAALDLEQQQVKLASDTPGYVKAGKQMRAQRDEQRQRVVKVNGKKYSFNF